MPIFLCSTTSDQFLVQSLPITAIVAMLAGLKSTPMFGVKERGLLQGDKARHRGMDLFGQPVVPKPPRPPPCGVVRHGEGGWMGGPYWGGSPRVGRTRFYVAALHYRVRYY